MGESQERSGRRNRTRHQHREAEARARERWVDGAHHPVRGLRKIEGARIMKTGIELISAERTRQISQEGWSPEHDDGHKRMEISQAAGAYTKAARLLVLDESSVNEIVNTRPIDWPWGLQSWKPSQDPIRNLVKAGALIAAEIDRLQIALIAKQKLDAEAAKLKC